MVTRNTRKLIFKGVSALMICLRSFIVRSQLSVMWKFRQGWPNLQLPLLVRSKPSLQSTSCVVLLSSFGTRFPRPPSRSVLHQPTRGTIIMPRSGEASPRNDLGQSSTLNFLHSQSEAPMLAARLQAPAAVVHGIR